MILFEIVKIKISCSRSKNNVGPLTYFDFYVIKKDGAMKNSDSLVRRYHAHFIVFVAILDRRKTGYFFKSCAESLII